MTVSRDSIPTRHQRILTEALLILELTHGIVELIDYIPTLLVLRRISKLHLQTRFCAVVLGFSGCSDRPSGLCSKP